MNSKFEDLEKVLFGGATRTETYLAPGFSGEY